MAETKGDDRKITVAPRLRRSRPRRYGKRYGVSVYFPSEEAELLDALKTYASDRGISLAQLLRCSVIQTTGLHKLASESAEIPSPL